jgi:hypothetical protein
MVTKAINRNTRKSKTAKTPSEIDGGATSSSNIELTSAGIWVWAGPVNLLDSRTILNELREERIDIVTGNHK